MNTVLTFVGQGSTQELAQARLDRGLNSNLVRHGNRVLKYTKPGLVEREAQMLQTAKKAGVSVPDCKVMDTNMLSIEFLPNGETLWDYVQHGKLTKELLAKVKQAVLTMWKAGIVHGDLHVNNIMISNNTVYIIDMASSFNAAILAETFGEDDYSADIKEGIEGDRTALLKSLAEARALVA